MTLPLTLPRAVPRPSLRLVSRLAVATVAANVLIVATGGLVRLTGSGLGCPTWPDCAPGSLLPTRELDWHKYVEFGNRTITVVVGMVSLLLLAAALTSRPARRDVRLGATAVFLGVPAQAVLGGITVLTDLDPWVVSLHFVLSAVIIAGATWLVRRTREGDAAPVRLVHPLLRRLAAALVAVTLGVIYLGTLVTGAGPHAGAPDVRRIPIEPRVIAQMHADAVMLLVGLTIGLAVAVWATGAPATVRRCVAAVVAVEVVQAAVGYAQYFSHLPIGLVDVHMLGATILVVAAVTALLSMRHRATAPVTDAAEPAVVVAAR